jgi:hypothetical protein
MIQINTYKIPFDLLNQSNVRYKYGISSNMVLDISKIDFSTSKKLLV